MFKPMRRKLSCLHFVVSRGDCRNTWCAVAIGSSKRGRLFLWNEHRVGKVVEAEDAASVNRGANRRTAEADGAIAQ